MSSAQCPRAKHQGPLPGTRTIVSCFLIVIPGCMIMLLFLLLLRLLEHGARPSHQLTQRPQQNRESTENTLENTLEFLQPACDYFTALLLLNVNRCQVAVCDSTMVQSFFNFVPIPYEKIWALPTIITACCVVSFGFWCPQSSSFLFVKRLDRSYYLKTQDNHFPITPGSSASGRTTHQQ